jgi:predicted amidophosphoribosyltransferase
MRALKSGRLNGSPPATVSTQVAEAFRALAQSRAEFAPFIRSGSVFVPVPRSSLRVEGALWIPDELAKALSLRTEGSRVAQLLSRTLAIPKAATSIPTKRPSALRHYETLAIQRELADIESITLVDDVVTSGAALLGSASRILEAYPNCQINGFASLRTISRAEELRSREEPVVGRISLRADGRCLRRP